MSLADMIAQRDAGTLPSAAAADTITTAELTRLDQETGIPAAIWQEAFNMAGSTELFDTVFNVWREHFVGIIDPRTIVADLRWALDAP